MVRRGNGRTLVVRRKDVGESRPDVDSNGGTSRAVGTNVENRSASRADRAAVRTYTRTRRGAVASAVAGKVVLQVVATSTANFDAEKSGCRTVVRAGTAIGTGLADRARFADRANMLVRLYLSPPLGMAVLAGRFLAATKGRSVRV